MIFKLEGQYYVDAKYGDDTNTGDKFEPFRTVNKAESVANDLDIIIIGSGSYSQIKIGNTDNKQFIYRGEGDVIFNGFGFNSGFATSSEFFMCDNITFRNYKNGAVAAFISSDTVRQKFINCRFFDCDVANEIGRAHV